VTFSTLPETAAATLGAAAATSADALVRHLPGPALLAQRHAGAPVPADLPGAVTATYVGASSADFALLLLDTAELAAAGGDAARLRLADVLRPALEQAASTIGGGMLGEIVEGAPATVFSSPDAVVFDLVGETGIAGWFAVVLRDRPAAPPAGDVTSRLGRIKNVEMTLAVEIGRARISVRDLLAAQPGTVIELDRTVGSAADVYLNGRLIAQGEIVVVDQQFAVRVTQVLDSADEG
jgi:flagellar motor switch protein FliN/FliY